MENCFFGFLIPEQFVVGADGDKANDLGVICIGIKNPNIPSYINTSTVSVHAVQLVVSKNFIKRIILKQQKSFIAFLAHLPRQAIIHF